MERTISPRKMHGGVRVPHRKNTASKGAIESPAPSKVVLPMAQHIGSASVPIVKNGEIVKVGQLVGESDGFISSNIYASAAGKVSLSEMTMLNGAVVQTVEIACSQEHEISETVAVPNITDAKSLVEAVKRSGLVGLGGASFPTQVKLTLREPGSVDVLVINGAECEPYITADHRAFLDKTEDLMYGIEVVKRVLGIRYVIVGIESNKPDAIEKMTPLLAKIDGGKVHKLRSRYPQGAEKVLIYETTGRVVPKGNFPIDVGCIVMNVSSAAFLGSYLKTGMPLIEKTITVDGGAIKEPCNITVKIGTPISEVAKFCGGYKGEVGKILMGGMMMGNAIPNDSFPIMKGTNAVLFLDEKEALVPSPTPCINCGRCAEACPMSLMPVEFEKNLFAKDYAALKSMSIELCIECGCCAYSCPAKRNLVQSIRMGKKKV